jgi:hypothetical protein
MIWLISHSLHPVSKLDRRRTGRLRKRDRLSTGAVEKGVGEEPTYDHKKAFMVLYKSFGITL